MLVALSDNLDDPYSDVRYEAMTQLAKLAEWCPESTDWIGATLVEVWREGRYLKPRCVVAECLLNVMHIWLERRGTGRWTAFLDR